MSAGISISYMTIKINLLDVILRGKVFAKSNLETKSGVKAAGLSIYNLPTIIVLELQ